MTSSRPLWVALGAIGAIAIAGGVSAVLWWAAPAGRMLQLAAFASVVPPLLAIVAYVLVVGLALLVWLPHGTRSSLGLAAGIGIAVSSMAVALSYQLLGNVTIAVWAPPALAVASLVAAAVRSARAGSLGVARLARSTHELVIGSGDLVAVVLAGTVLFTVSRFGLAAWTTLVNDFHRYAGSAMIWLSDSGVGAPFLEKFPGQFGATMAARAAHEKPGTTGLLVIASQVSGLDAYELLTPLSILLLTVLLSALVVILRRGFGLGLAAALVCTAAPSLSLIPMSRVFDAQLGQLAAAALIATALAVVSIERDAAGSWPTALRGALAGVCAAAAISTNATLVLSFAPVAALVGAWIIVRRRWRRSAVVRYVPAALIAAAAASLPFAAAYAKSVLKQTGGESGVEVPFPLPTALLGLQPSLEANALAPAVWAILGLGLLVWLVIRRPRGVDVRFLVATLALSAAMLAALALVYGFENYTVHKWLGLWISTVGPVVLGAVVVHVAGRAAIVATAALGLAGLTALVFSSHFGYQTGNVVSPGQFAVSQDERLADIDHLNADFQNLYLNSLVSLALPARTVHVVDRTYAEADPPVGNDFAISAGTVPLRDWMDVHALGGGLSLASLDLSLGAGTVGFAADEAGARNHLFGAWFASEAPGTWSMPGEALVVFDAGDGLDGNVMVQFDATLMGAPDLPGAATVSVFNEPVLQLQSTDAVSQSFTIEVDRATIDAHDGRVVIRFSSVSGVSPAQMGDGEDARPLVIGLRSMTLTAGG